MAQFVWNIEIQGADNIPREEILALVQENGLAVGKLKNSVDTKEVINKIRLERDDIAWAGIEMEGTNVIIKLVEADENQKLLTKTNTVT